MSMFDPITIANYLADNPQWLLIFAFCLAFAETLAFISIFVPSTPILVAVGAAVSTEHVAFWPLWLGASVGAITGSCLSWWLGKRYGAELLHSPKLGSNAALVARTSALFARFGGFALIAGHFIGPLRSLIFIFAGMTRMRFVHFIPFNVVGAVAWAYVIPKVGEVGGHLIALVWNWLGF